MAEATWHFEANDIFGFDGRPVERWSSKDAKTPDFIQDVGSKRPVIRKQIVAGNNALEFRGNYHHHMFSEELGDDRFDNVDEFTTLCVCKVNKEDNHKLHSWGYYNSSDYMWEQLVDSNQLTTLRKNESGDVNSSVVSMDKTGWNVVASRHSSNSIQQIVNKESAKTVNGEYIDLYDHWKTFIGSSVKKEKNTLNGYIAEFIAYNTYLSNSKINNVISDLLKKYNIS